MLFTTNSLIGVLHSPPLKKCVKKIKSWNVKKENLFERSELFSFSGMAWFLAIFSAAAAFFASFYLLKKKRKSLSGLRTIINQYY